MLFPLDPATPECKVFEVLNNELLYFLQLSISATDFNEDLFSCYQVNRTAGTQFIRSVCWTNNPTRKKFKKLWDVLPVDIQERQDLYDLVNGAQNIPIYFTDTTMRLPELPNNRIFDAFKALTSYLFTDTKDLSSAIIQAGRSIHGHYQDFLRANNNSKLCYCCGTERLSQNRDGVGDEKQWRAAYDHILCKDKNPIFSIHPDNFIPTCHTCNSYAKGTDELLVNKRQHRRIAFYPLAKVEAETCYQYSKVFPEFLSQSDFIGGQFGQPISNVKIIFPNVPFSIAKKIVVWKEVYGVPSRVSSEIRDAFIESISAGLAGPINYAEFIQKLSDKVVNPPADIKINSWSCWWFRVYQWLNSQPQRTLEDIWGMFEWKLGLASEDHLTAEDDYDAIFGY